MPSDQWKLILNDVAYETVSMAARRLKLSRRSVESIIARHRLKPDEHFDGRTPVYLLGRITKRGEREEGPPRSA